MTVAAPPAYAEAAVIEHRCSAAEARVYGADTVYVAWGHIADSDALQWEGVHADRGAAVARVAPCTPQFIGSLA